MEHISDRTYPIGEYLHTGVFLLSVSSIVAIGLPQIPRYFRTISVHIGSITLWSILESLCGLFLNIPVQFVRFVAVGFYVPYLFGFCVTFLFMNEWIFFGVMLGPIALICGGLHLAVYYGKWFMFDSLVDVHIGFIVVSVLFVVVPIIVVILEKLHRPMV